MRDGDFVDRIWCRADPKTLPSRDAELQPANPRVELLDVECSTFKRRLD